MDRLALFVIILLPVMLVILPALEIKLFAVCLAGDDYSDTGRRNVFVVVDNEDGGDEDNECQEIRLWVARQGQQEERESFRDQSLSYKQATLGTGCEVALSSFPNFPLLPFPSSSSYSQVYLSYHGLGPHHFYVSRADQAPALARLMEEVGHHVIHLKNLLGDKKYQLT